MGLLARFTRDGASKFVWGSLLLAAVLGLVSTLMSGGEAIRQERRAAERRSVAHVEGVLVPRLEGMDLRSPIAGPDLAALREALDRSIMEDPRVARVRIWSADGVLLFSTAREELGSSAALNDELLQLVSGGTTLTRWNVSDVGGVDQEGRSLIRTYTPIRAGAVAEVDHAEDETVGPVARSWLNYQILAGVAVAFFLGMTVLSLREPLDRINVGVPFAPTNVPAGYSLIDDERLHAVEEVYRLAHERVAKLEQRLAESEEVRRALEGDLQRALTTAASGATASAPAVRMPSAPADPATRAPASRPPTLIERATQPAAAETRSAPAPKERRKERRKKRAASTPERVGRPAAAAEARPIAPASAAAPAPPSDPAPAQPAEPDVVSVPDSEVLSGDWNVAPAGALLARAFGDDSSAPRRRPAATSDEPKRPRRRRKAEPIARAVAAPPATDPGDEDARAHEAALETFIRLTESDRQHQEAPEVDQGAVRAALARTAARKKPGGAGLQAPERRVQEVQGGGPPRDDR